MDGGKVILDKSQYKIPNNNNTLGKGTQTLATDLTIKTVPQIYCYAFESDKYPEYNNNKVSANDRHYHYERVEFQNDKTYYSKELK